MTFTAYTQVQQFVKVLGQIVKSEQYINNQRQPAQLSRRRSFSDMRTRSLLSGIPLD